MRYSKCFLLAVSLGASLLAAQEKRTAPVSGNLVYDTPGAAETGFDRYVVELRTRANAYDMHRANVTWDGSFEFRNVAEGMYELNVIDKTGATVKTDIVTVAGFGGANGIRVKMPATGAAIGAPVSMKRLSHKPPKAAKKALQAAVKAQNKGDVGAWEAKLREAVSLDQGYFEARNNLGAFLARTNRPVEAVEHLRAALSIDPNATAVLNNLSAALLALKDHKQAEQAARQALRIEPNSPQGHYLLGIALVMQQRYTSEAAEHLEASSETFPKAEQAAAFVREKIRKQAEE